jgi:ElaB/YqjD/DUF883 family membrane-anchored ribosome-binding protein
MERFNSWVDRYPYKGMALATGIGFLLVVVLNLVHIGGLV